MFAGLKSLRPGLRNKGKNPGAVCGRITLRRRQITDSCTRSATSLNGITPNTADS